MNTQEQFKNTFLLELNKEILEVMEEYYEAIEYCLTKTMFDYDINVKNTALTIVQDPVPQLVKIYLVVKKTEGLAEGTLENYWRILKSFFEWSRKQPEEIVANDIRMFLYFYQQDHSVSNRTLDKYREMICWFFSWAHKEEYISRDPTTSIKPIKHEIKERQALTQLELEYLRKACKTPRQKAILEFLYSTGCRVSEMIQVKKDDINWKDNTVHLFGKGQKHRTSFINAKAEVAIKDYLATRRDECEFLFVSERAPIHGIKKESIEKIIRELAQMSEITRHVTPHILRHTCATQALESGMPIEDVSKLLGHAQVNTTMIYAKASLDKVQNEHRRCIV